jgi:cytochrome d ubiquinol oxidase subunit II
MVSAGTFFVRSPATFGAPPASGLGAILALASLVALRVALARERYARAFVASSCFLAGLLLSAAGTIFPYLLPGFPDPRTGLDIYHAASPPVAMTTALVVAIVGLALLAVYRTFLARKLTSG